jgi:hypothetical protein
MSSRSRPGDRRRPGQGGAADFGRGAWRPRGLYASPRLIAALAIGMALAVAAGSRLKDETGDIATARRWAIAGPPCQALTAGAFAALQVRPHISFQYDDVAFDHGYGGVYCDDIHDDGGRGLGEHPVCQFTGPAVLKVTTRKGVFYFFPSTGHATVTVENGVATCVRGGWYPQVQW